MGQDLYSTKNTNKGEKEIKKPKNYKIAELEMLLKIFLFEAMALSSVG